MEKFKSYAGMFLLATLAGVAALKIYEQMNKPKISLPATTAATD